MKSPQNEMKSLNKARQENAGKDLKNFEVMDAIYQRVRNKTNDSLGKLDGLLHQQARQLYYEKKADIYQLLKDKKRQDELNIEKFLEKNNSEKPPNQMLMQEKRLKQICQEFNIDVKTMRLPYKEKIRQICNNLQAFYRYKKDQRDVLDQNLLKNNEFIEQNLQNEEYLRVLMRVQYIGENALNEKEQAIYEKLKEIRRLNHSLDKRQEFYLQQLERKRKILEESDNITQKTPKHKNSQSPRNFSTNKVSKETPIVQDLDQSSFSQSVSLGTASSCRSQKTNQNNKNNIELNHKTKNIKQLNGPDDLVIQEDNNENNPSNLSTKKQNQFIKRNRNMRFLSQGNKSNNQQRLQQITFDQTFVNLPKQQNQLPYIPSFQISPKPFQVNASMHFNGTMKLNQQKNIVIGRDATFISSMRVNSGDISARTSEQNLQSTERQSNQITSSRLDNNSQRTSINFHNMRNQFTKIIQSEQNSPRLPQSNYQIQRGGRLKPLRKSLIIDADRQQNLMQTYDDRLNMKLPTRTSINSPDNKNQNNLNRLLSKLQTKLFNQDENESTKNLKSYGRPSMGLNENQCNLSNEIQNSGKRVQRNLINSFVMSNPPVLISADYSKLKDITKNQKSKVAIDFMQKKSDLLQKIEFKLKTPNINDEDIKHLIKLYPPSRFEHEKQQIEEAEKVKNWQKKTLDKILKNIDKMENQNKTDQDKIIYDMLVQNIRDDEFMRTVEKLKEIDFAESVILQTLFEYKLKDEHDQLDLANEVAKEYHSGKLDPLLALRIERKNKIKQNQKNIKKVQQQKEQ